MDKDAELCYCEVDNFVDADCCDHCNTCCDDCCDRCVSTREGLFSHCSQIRLDKILPQNKLHCNEYQISGSEIRGM